VLLGVVGMFGRLGELGCEDWLLPPNNPESDLLRSTGGPPLDLPEWFVDAWRFLPAPLAEPLFVVLVWLGPALGGHFLPLGGGPR
jgi:hypothetical protein